MTQVVDNGSDMRKTEVAGDDASREVIPSSVDNPEVPGIKVGMDQKDSCVDEGRMSWRVSRLLEKYVVGFISCWEKLELAW